ncbi:hypothetical protein FD755_002941 [Muntiacus reevesi]|uniref:Alpha-N-acetylneuraminide alpha-2,8-sialyltransferase n=1 Tax=Muntiacus reevesi TaxID=9886 RepID=A0A5J5N5S1_MUNRE|nr:hypothetical protein FD755_002941 [Muntiacus reevesi]
MSPCGRARRHTSRGAMAVLAWKFPRTRLPVGASALCIVVLCWLYVFPVYRLPDEKEIVQGVLQQGTAWRRNRTAAGIFSLAGCTEPIVNTGHSLITLSAKESGTGWYLLGLYQLSNNGYYILIVSPPSS